MSPLMSPLSLPQAYLPQPSSFQLPSIDEEDEDTYENIEALTLVDIAAQTSSGDMDDDDEKTLYSIKAALCQPRTDGSCKLDDLDAAKLVALVKHFIHLDDDVDLFFSEIGERLESADKTGWVTALSLPEIFALGKDLQSGCHKTVCSIQSSLIAELIRVRSDGKCRFEYYSLSEAAVILKYFAIGSPEGADLLILFIRKFIVMTGCGEYDFSLFSIDALMYLFEVVSSFADENQELYDALFQEFLRPERMDAWVIHEEVIPVLSLLARKNELASPFFIHFEHVRLRKKSSENEISLEDFDSCAVVKILAVFADQETEYREVFQACQKALIQREFDDEADTDSENETVKNEENLSLLCELSLELIRMNCIEDDFLNMVESLLADSGDTVEAISTSSLANFLTACNKRAYDLDEPILKNIFATILDAQQNGMEGDYLSIEDFLELTRSFDQESASLNNRKAFCTIFADMVVAVSTIDTVISKEQYKILYQSTKTVLKNIPEKLFLIFYAELQEEQVPAEWALHLNGYTFKEIIQIALHTPKKHSASLLPLIEKELLSRKEEFVAVEPKELAQLISRFREKRPASKELFSLFDELVLNRGNQFLALLKPGQISMMTRSFLDSGSGSSQLYGFLLNGLLTEDRGIKPRVQMLAFEEMCKLLKAFVTASRGIPWLYKKIEEEFLSRAKKLKQDELPYLLGFITIYHDLHWTNKKLFEGCVDLMVRNECAWLKTRSLKELAELTQIDTVMNERLADGIHEQFFELITEDEEELAATSSTCLTNAALALFRARQEKTHDLFERIEKHLIANPQRLGESLDTAGLCYIHFLSAEYGSSEFLASLEEKIGHATSPYSNEDLVSLYQLGVKRGANTAFVEALIAELLTRGIPGFIAVCAQDEEKLAILLINRGFDPRQVNGVGDSALHIAANAGFLETVTLLLGKQVLINSVNKDGGSALHYAFYKGRLDIAKLLIAHGANITLKYGEKKQTPVQLALQSLEWKNNRARMKEFCLHFFGRCPAMRQYIESDDRKMSEFTSYFAEHPELVLQDCEEINPLEIAFLLQDSNTLLSIALNIDVLKSMGWLDDLQAKYPNSPKGSIIGALFSAFCKRRLEQEALILLERKECDFSFSLPTGDTLLHIAIEADSRVLVRKLVEKKIELHRLNNQGKTPLHVSIKLLQEKNSLEIISLLLEQEGFDPFRPDHEGNTPFVIIRTDLLKTLVDPLEAPLLLQDFELAQERIKALSYDEFQKALKKLKIDYPYTATEFIEYAGFSIDPEHLKHNVRSEIPPKPEGATLDELVQIFEEVNFTDPQKPHYFNPADFESETGTRLVRDLSEMLEVDFIKKIKTRRSYNGTPNAGSAALEIFYSTIERSVLHTIKKLKTTQDPLQKAKTIIEYLRAAKFCGGRIMNVSLDRYDAVVQEIPPSFEKTIYELLGEFRKHLLDSLVLAGEQSVHVANKYFECLADDLNLPNKTAKFIDPHAAAVDKNELRMRFDKLYRPLQIMNDCLYLRLQEEGLRNQCIDWFKANVPQEFDRERIEPIKAKLAEFEARGAPRAEIVQFLQGHEIFVQEGSYAAAIEDDRVQAYLGKEVFVDMTAEKMQIKKSAIAYALQKLAVIKEIRR